jgi:hypothetical protein
MISALYFAATWLSSSLISPCLKGRGFTLDLGNTQAASSSARDLSIFARPGRVAGSAGVPITCRARKLSLRQFGIVAAQVRPTAPQEKARSTRGCLDQPIDVGSQYQETSARVQGSPRLPPRLSPGLVRRYVNCYRRARLDIAARVHAISPLPAPISPAN